MVMQLLEDLINLPPVRTLVMLFSLFFKVSVPRLLFIAARQVATHVTFISLSEVIFLLIDFLLLSFKIVAVVLGIL